MDRLQPLAHSSTTVQESIGSWDAQEPCQNLPRIQVVKRGPVPEHATTPREA